MGLLLFNVLLHLLLPATALFVLWNVLVTGKFKSSWRQRLTLSMPEPPPGKPVLHVHAASVGEALALGPMLAELRRLLPDHALLVTSLSETGAATVRERLKPDVATYLPLDYPWLVSRFLERYRPRAVVLVETELWPNLLAGAYRRAIPVLAVNGRISPGTQRRYQVASALYRPLVGRLAVFAAQSLEDAGRAGLIGVPLDRIRVLGDLKYDQIADNPSSPRLDEVRRTLKAPSPRVLCAGSTHAGEHEELVQNFAGLLRERPDTWLILAPRKPDEVAGAEAALRAAGVSYVRRSEQRAAGAAWPEDRHVLLVDTMGELAFLYDACAVAFVGGSLVPVGGHSPLEPAVLGKPVLFGPQAFNFEDADRLLLDAGAARLVKTQAELLGAARELLETPDVAAAMGARGRDAVLSKSGASKAAAALIRDYLPPMPL